MKRKEKYTYYNYQFKHTAVTVMEHPNIQAVDVAEALQIHPIMLYRWRGEMRDGKIKDNNDEARSITELMQARKKVMAFRYIDEHKETCSVALLCRKLDVSRQDYYTWKQRGKSQRQQVNERLLKKVVRIHKASRETYGYPRVHAALKQQGETCLRNRVARLMRTHGDGPTLQETQPPPSSDTGSEEPAFGPRPRDQSQSGLGLRCDVYSRGSGLKLPVYGDEFIHSPDHWLAVCA